MRTSFVLSVVSVASIALASAGCGQAATAGPPYKAAADVEQLMEGVVDPAARVYWNSVSTTISAKGIEEKFPQTDEEWNAVWGAALTVAESGNLMMMSPRARDNESWIKMSAELVDVGMLAAKAAKDRRPEDVLSAGEQVYNVCTRCHMKYLIDAIQ
jgi:hypothetical protein